MNIVFLPVFAGLFIYSQANRNGVWSSLFSKIYASSVLGNFSVQDKGLIAGNFSVYDKGLIAGNPSDFDILMHVMGVLSSILTYSGIFGFLMLILSPVVIIYNMITVIPHMSFKGLKSYGKTLYGSKELGLLVQLLDMLGFLYHYATGFTSALIYTIFLYLGGQINKDAFDDTNPNLQSAQDYSIFMGGIGILLGTVVGAFFILPVSLLGFFTLPITLPITIWKTIDKCPASVEYWYLCAFLWAPMSDLFFASRFVLFPGK